VVSTERESPSEFQWRDKFEKQMVVTKCLENQLRLKNLELDSLRSSTKMQSLSSQSAKVRSL
jgi:hypothetical protein